MKNKVLISLTLVSLLFALPANTLPPNEVYMVVDSCRDVGDPNADPFVRGYVYVIQNGLPEVKWPDNCLSPNLLQEYFCVEIDAQTNPRRPAETRWTKRFVQCQYGCRNGACLPRDPPLCTDSDGNDTFTSGNVVDGNNPPSNDECVDLQHVREWVCENDTAKQSTHFCTDGCDNGACRRPTACIAHGEELPTEEHHCCFSFTPKRDLWSEERFICCGRFECAGDGTCFRSGTEIDDNRCVRGTWRKQS